MRSDLVGRFRLLDAWTVFLVDGFPIQASRTHVPMLVANGAPNGFERGDLELLFPDRKRGGAQVRKASRKG